MKKILIVEDNISINNLLKELLSKEYSTISAYSGTEASLLLNSNDIDLILLDLTLPGISGLEIIKKYNNIPIIVLSANKKITDKTNTLLIGANDYITKPFNNDELLARIKVQLRINEHNNKDLKYKELKLLNDSHTLLINDNKVNLTKTEYAILKQLLLSPSSVISKSRLLDLISIDTIDCDENSLKVHISNIKRKIRKYTSYPYIECIWGLGYKMYNDNLN